MVGFEKVLGAVKVIKDQIQYRSQSLLNLACDYFIDILNGSVSSDVYLRVKCHRYIEVYPGGSFGLRSYSDVPTFRVDFLT